MRIALAFVLLFAATGAAAQPAAVQIRAGHARLALTLDTYGHLLDAQDGDRLAAAEKLVLG